MFYWPTSHQVIRSHFFEVRRLDEHWAKILQSENISIPIYVECDKMSRSKVCVQEFSYFVSGLLIFNLKNPSTTVLYAKKSVAGGEIWRVIYSLFRAIDTNHSNQWLSGQHWLQRVGRCGFKSWGVLKRSQAAAPRTFCVALSPSVHWHTSFSYCCTLYNFSFLGFRQWQSRTDRVVNLNTTIWLPLFWRTWTWALARSRPHVLALHMDRDYSNCRASDMTDHQVSGFVFSWFLENTEKMKAS